MFDLFELSKVWKRSNVISPFGILCCHEGEEDGDTGGGGGAGEGEGKGEGDKGEGGDKTTDPNPPTGTTRDFTIKVDGVETKVVLTDTELRDRVQLSYGADKRFAEAAQIKKQYEKGGRVLDLTESLRGSDNPTQADLDELMGLLGLGQVNLADYIGDNSDMDQNNGDNKGGKNDAGDKGSAGNQQGTPTAVGLEQLDPRVRNAVQAAERQALTEIRTRIENQVKEALDKDEVLSKMVGDSPSDVRDAIKREFYDMGIEDVRANILGGTQEFGTRMVDAAVQKIRARAKSLGISALAPGNPPITGFGQTLGTNPQIRSTEPIKRVSSSDSDYEQNAVDRIQQNIVKAMK
jgi:hypothetical protein